MNDVILIVIAGLIVFAVGLPFVVAYSKWKKKMQNEEINSESEDE
jgi:hypothetical protein